MSNVKKIIDDYLKFSGVRSADDIKKLLNRANETNTRPGSPEYFKLAHIRQQLTKAYFVAVSQQSKMLNIDVNPGSLFKHDDEGLGKFTDTGDVPGGGRQNNYWEHNKPKLQFDPKNTRVRRGPQLPGSFNLEDEKFLLKFFDLRAVEYGNWLTQQDRVNYLAGCALALYDLQKVLGFSSHQMGLFGKITLAFGARGRGSALAHFEPGTFAINLTRFSRPKNGTYAKPGYDRSKLLFYSGGVGTFCHEFGHALDYYGGYYVDPLSNTALSAGRGTRTATDRELMKKSGVRAAMERLLHRIIWKKDDSEQTEYYKRIKAQAKKTEGGTYWIQRNEIFARCFETYVYYKLKKKGWFNVFLNETKYDDVFYPKQHEIREVEKLFDELIRKLQSGIKQGTAKKKR